MTQCCVPEMWPLRRLRAFRSGHLCVIVRGMAGCRACSLDAPEGSRFCPQCGAPLGLDSGTETRTSIPGGGAASSNASPARRLSSEPSDQGRFLPGTVLAGRYRLFGLLGRGGMGEVYRADDLKLGQAVALKFLPADFQKDAARLQRFLNEVKIARQISHPNVCRVYDVGELNEHHFLSMEYVDGEDLASLLRRIGRLPRDKAVEIARQLCAGLAAAHDQGVLHRDLKPANIMIDGRGRAKIADFGLAALAVDVTGPEAGAGTPAYMAPEQRAGKGVSIRSDIYSLGLVLYELFTGKAAFSAASAAERARLQEESTPTSPSQHVGGLDPAVERAILRCLERAPEARPASALLVAASLPGGDPLEAALAAGETPSPEMVAAAGAQGALSPAAAWALLAATLVGLIVLCALAAPTQILSRIEPPKAPQVLAERAREIFERFGYTEEPNDTDFGFDADQSYLDFLRKRDPSPDRWQPLSKASPAALYYWFRRSPAPLTTWRNPWNVSPDDPPARLPGMASVRLDTRGKLIALDVIPPIREDAAERPKDPDWSSLFGEAGLDIASFTPAAPSENPLLHSDVRAAWTGAHPQLAATPIRVEAGAYRGRPNFFRIVGPWTPSGGAGGTKNLPQAIGRILQTLILIVPLTVAVVLARRNLRVGRGDRDGAFRIALAFFLVHVVAWVLRAHHVPSLSDEFTLAVHSTGYTLFYASALWLLYVALEPFVRQKWPHCLVSWSRLIAGGFRDPLVGRHILAGSALGVAFASLNALADRMPAWLGMPPSQPQIATVSVLRGIGTQLSWVIDRPIHAVLDCMVVLFLLVFVRVVVRRGSIAAFVIVVIFTATVSLDSDNQVISLIANGIIVSTCASLVARGGLLPLVSAVSVFYIMQITPITTHWTSWYASATLIALAACAAIAVYAFRIAIAGKPLFGGIVEEGAGRRTAVPSPPSLPNTRI